MAKKITKEPNIKQYKAKCPVCQCEFEFDTTDANWHIRELRPNNVWGDLGNTVTRIDCNVQCPKCNTWVENQQIEVQ